MLQDANNFYYGSGVISRLYMGNTLVWPELGPYSWNFKQSLYGDSINDEAGRNVACSSDGNIVVYTSPLDSQGILFGGAAWIYTGTQENGWNFKQKITGNQFNGRLSRVGINKNGNIIGLGVFGNYNYTGAVWLYTGDGNNNWVFKQELTGDGGEQEWFGRTIKMNNSGNVIVVGAQYDNNNSGAGYIFTGNAINGWKFAQKLTYPTPYGIPGFNRLSINKDGSIIVMGGFVYSSDPSFVGIFTGNPSIGVWDRKQLLSGNLEGFSDTIFLWRNGYSGTYTKRGIFNNKPYYNLVGQSNSSTVSSISWSTTRNQWELSNNLGNVFYSGSQNTNFPWQVTNWTGLPPTTYFNVLDGFGISTDINDDGDTIVIGAPWDSEAGDTVGALNIYTGNSIDGWFLKEKKLGDSVSGMHGWNVAVSANSNVIVGGSPHDSHPYAIYTGPKSYSIVYEGNKYLGWKAKQKIAETNGTGGFGTYIDLSFNGDIIFVGGPYDSTNQSRAGAVMIYYKLNENLWSFLDNPYDKTLSGFKIAYANGSVTADWGDGNISGIISNQNYNHKFK